MKKADYDTGFVMIRAETNSDWDCCDFAIIHVTDEWRQIMQRRLEAVASFQTDYRFNYHSYWDCPEGFYQKPDDKAYSADEIIGKHENWCFIELDKKELEEMAIPESSLDGEQLIIDKSGLACFKAHNSIGEEFYTADFNVAELLPVPNNKAVHL